MSLAKFILGEQNIGDSSEAERDQFAHSLIEAIEKAFPGLEGDYNPLSGASIEWQELFEDSHEEKAQEISDWIDANWESVLSKSFA